MSVHNPYILLPCRTVKTGPRFFWGPANQQTRQKTVQRKPLRAETLENKEENYVRIIFHDRGAGISARLLDRISEPFYSTKPKNEGTGLGLSISHGIIENHRGKLRFESVEGEYTKVIVDLPLNKGREL